jgi:hypothetical protein
VTELKTLNEGWAWNETPSPLYGAIFDLTDQDGRHRASLWKMVRKPGYTGTLADGSHPQRGPIQEVAAELEGAATLKGAT